jgi:glucosylglycerate synthase
MAEESILSDDFIRQLINVGEVDIIVGVPTHNDAKTVGPAIQAIQAGILKAFPRERVVIINTDGGSTDGTPDIVLGASISDVHRSFNGYTLRTLHSISTQYAKTPSPELVFRTILSAADLLRAKACTIISADAPTVESGWVENLLRPVYREKFDLVTPIYRRHKYEGVLVTNLIYPMTRALYGFRLREPYSSDVAFSSRLGCDFLVQNRWGQGSEHDDPRMEFTIHALSNGFRVHQSFLGSRTQSNRHARDLVQTMRQTMGTLFSTMEPKYAVWNGKTGSEPVSTKGPEFEVTDAPLRVNRKQLKEMFAGGVSELASVLETILTPGTLGELQQVASADEANCRLGCELWVKTVYEFAVSYHKTVINRDHILQALVPLYRGRMFTFFTETRAASSAEVANNIESLCLQFERMKPYLLELWNGGK